jgi:hypothetical protein
MCAFAGTSPERRAREIRLAATNGQICGAGKSGLLRPAARRPLPRAGARASATSPTRTAICLIERLSNSRYWRARATTRRRSENPSRSPDCRLDRHAGHATHLAWRFGRAPHASANTPAGRTCGSCRSGREARDSRRTGAGQPEVPDSGCQGLSSGTPQPSKSPMLRVTTVRP